MPSIEVRRLMPTDAEAFVALRRQALQEEPPAARRLYERLGFTRRGDTEEAALCHEGRLVAEHHMVLFL